MDILITNNPKCEKHFEGVFHVEYVDGTPLDVLKNVRGRVHLGHGLVSHPMAGGLPPGTTPYKSVAVSADCAVLSAEFVGIVENAVERYSRHGDFYPSTNLEQHAQLDLSLLRRS
ncbi:MAG: GrdX family protein [Defluviitaleaceae bacterium]|nr:GrdX family protein [Defluviitaleaceae bacterium]